MWFKVQKHIREKNNLRLRNKIILVISLKSLIIKGALPVTTNVNLQKKKKKKKHTQPK